MNWKLPPCQIQTEVVCRKEMVPVLNSAPSETEYSDPNPSETEIILEKMRTSRIWKEKLKKLANMTETTSGG